MKKSIIVALTFLSSIYVVAQSRIDILFDETTHDFGTVYDSDGIVSTQFKLMNVSAETIHIDDIQTSCGCVNVKYDLKTLSTNAVCTIYVEYNTNGYYGKFAEDITIKISNDIDSRTQELTITGNSIDDSSDEQEYQLGDIRLRVPAIEIGSVLQGDIVTKVLEIKNTSRKAQKISFDKVPKHIRIDTDYKKRLQAGDKSNIYITYDSNKANKLGIDTALVYVKQGRKRVGYIPIVSDTKHNFIREYSYIGFSYRPIINISPQYLNGSYIPMGGKYKVTLSISNQGVSPLEIRNIKSFHSNITVPKKTRYIIAPQDAISLEVIIDTKHQQPGKYYGSIQIISSDPESPTRNITVEWIVVSNDNV